MDTYYKCFGPDMTSPYGADLPWFLPVQQEDGTWTPGAWAPAVKGPLELCANGYHYCTLAQLPVWLNATIYVVEPGQEHLDGTDKACARKLRLVRPTAWDEQRARLFAADCAEYVVALYERQAPGDTRVRDAIAVARRYANGQATPEELRAARSAAESAAGSAAGSAARSAAWSAAESAAWSAAWSAAESAAWSAARSAAWSAAWSAAESAAWSAAWSAARSAALGWQSSRLALYLDGPIPAPYVAKSAVTT